MRKEGRRFADDAVAANANNQTLVSGVVFALNAVLCPLAHVQCPQSPLDAKNESRNGRTDEIHEGIELSSSTSNGSVDLRKKLNENPLSRLDLFSFRWPQRGRNCALVALRVCSETSVASLCIPLVTLEFLIGQEGDAAGQQAPI